MNPVNWLAWIYGKWFQHHGIIGGVVVVGVWACFGLVLWVRAVDKFKEDHTVPPAQSNPIQQNSSGSNSPNIAGNNNTVIINAPAALHPPKKGERTPDIAEGSFLGKGFRESQTDKDLVHVRVAGFDAANPRGWLKRGELLRPYTRREDNYSPITVGMDKQGKLLFTCSLLGGDEDHPFQLQIANNVFKVPTGFVQKNYNDKALEIADDNGVPLFQVIQESPNELRINGVFSLYQSPDTGKIVRLWAWGSRFEIDSERPKDFELKPIFKYPSWKYLGQYAN